MSKAMLILDEMPECCDHCRFRENWCFAVPEPGEADYQADTKVEREPWCPLIEINKRPSNLVLDEFAETLRMIEDGRSKVTYIKGGQR